MCSRPGAFTLATTSPASLVRHWACGSALTRTVLDLADTALLCASCHADLHRGTVLPLKDGRRLGPDGWAA